MDKFTGREWNATVFLAYFSMSLTYFLNYLDLSNVPLIFFLKLVISFQLIDDDHLLP